MSMKGIIARCGGALLLLCGLSACGGEDAVKGCVNGAMAQYFEAKAAFQRSMRDLTVAGDPALEAVAKTEADLEISKGQARMGMLDHLLTHDPDRIDLSNGIVVAANYNWTDEDLAELEKTDPSFGALVARIQTLQAEYDNHPDGPALSDYFRDELSNSAGYEALTAKLEAGLKEADAAFAQCGD